MGANANFSDGAPIAPDPLQSLTAAINLLRAEVAQRHSENATVNAEQTGKLDEVIKRVDELNRAFPNGDLDLHRRMHEAMIEKENARTAFYSDLRSDLAKKGLLFIFGVLGLALAQYLRTKLATIH